MDGTLEKLLKGHDSIVNGVQFNVNSRMFASISDDLTIKIWNFDT